MAIVAFVSALFGFCVAAMLAMAGRDDRRHIKFIVDPRDLEDMVEAFREEIDEWERGGDA